MQFSVEEFRPPCPIMFIEGEEFELSLITLNIDARLKEKISRLENIFEEIKKRPELLLEVIWLLVLDKSRFAFRYEKFKQRFLSSGSTVDQTKKCYEALSDSIARSMPLIKNKRRYDELNKIRNTQSDESKPCYGVYYDTIAKRYSYSIDQFYNLTLRQLHILLNVIGDKGYEELEVQAALQGKKLKPRIKFEDVSEEDDKKMDNEAAEIYARLKAEYEKKKGK